MERKKDKCQCPFKFILQWGKNCKPNAKLKTNPYTIINPNVTDAWVTLRPHRTPCDIHQNWNNIWLGAWFLDIREHTQALCHYSWNKVIRRYFTSQWNCAPKYVNENSTSVNNFFLKKYFQNGWHNRAQSRHFFLFRYFFLFLKY